MSAAELVNHLLNGLSYSMLIFLVAVGLTLILGLMDVINLSHGSLFMVGGYVAISGVRSTDSFLLAILIAAGVTLVIGLLVERLLLRPFYARGHLDQVLLTLGLVYIIADLSLWIWGPQIQDITLPAALSSSSSLFGIEYPVYRLVLVVIGLGLAATLFYIERRTIYGAIIRAGVTDRETVSALGINIERVTMVGFGIGALLAGLAGALAVPTLGAYPGIDISMLITSLVVVVIGGLGTLAGSFVGSLLVGMTQTFGQVLLPEFASFTVFALMVIVLLVRPQGLLGRQLR